MVGLGKIAWRLLATTTAFSSQARKSVSASMVGWGLNAARRKSAIRVPLVKSASVANWTFLQANAPRHVMMPASVVNQILIPAIAPRHAMM
jgi:hypothetical protein